MARRARIVTLDLNGAQNMNTQLLQQARVLEIDEQIELVEAIWDGIVSRGAAPPLTEAQKTELDRRLADHLANPNDVVSWSEVKAAALSKTRQ
jgi:putative addiction module component (TIGR02574 family)